LGAFHTTLHQVTLRGSATNDFAAATSISGKKIKSLHESIRRPSLKTITGQL
jgi:hypothetical protein